MPDSHQTLVEGRETFLPLRVYFLATSWRVPSAYGQKRKFVKRTLSMRPDSTNDRFRLGAAAQIIELRQAENDPKRK